MLTIATCIWDPNVRSYPWSTMYTEAWVDRLYRGFARNLSVPFEFICYTDRIPRQVDPNIRLIPFRVTENDAPTYGDFLQPYELGRPMILAGLDTVITGDCDELAQWVLDQPEGAPQALPRDPYDSKRACNGVALSPAGNQRVADLVDVAQSDMDRVRECPHVFLDDIFPGQVVSYKGQVCRNGIGDARIVYFHGKEKPHELPGSKIEHHWLAP